MNVEIRPKKKREIGDVHNTRGSKHHIKRVRVAKASIKSELDPKLITVSSILEGLSCNCSRRLGSDKSCLTACFPLDSFEDSDSRDRSMYDLCQQVIKQCRNMRNDEKNVFIQEEIRYFIEKTESRTTRLTMHYAVGLKHEHRVCIDVFCKMHIISTRTCQRMLQGMKAADDRRIASDKIVRWDDSYLHDFTYNQARDVFRRNLDQDTETKFAGKYCATTVCFA